MELSQIEVFCELEEDLAKQLISRGVVRTLTGGELIQRRGEEARWVVLVRQGELWVCRLAQSRCT